MSTCPSAIVTGASRGIGKAIAVRLAREGFAVLVNYRSRSDAAEAVGREIESAGGVRKLCQADVTRSADRQRIVETALEAFGRVDLLVNNAGIAPAQRKDILETDEATFDAVLETNLKATYFMTQVAAGAMIKLRQVGTIERGTIVNMASIRSFTTALNYGEYCVSKAGVTMVTHLFANRLAEYDIAVHEIAPGIVETDMTASSQVRSYYDDKLSAGMAPMNRWGKPDEVASAVAAIARGDFPYCTGQTFHVDGGWHIRSL